MASAFKPFEDQKLMKDLMAGHFAEVDGGRADSRLRRRRGRGR
jgi:hypothetical protein